MSKWIMFLSHIGIPESSTRSTSICFQLLLRKGANVNAQGEDFNYGNPLMVTSYTGCEEVLRLLLDKGANVNARDRTCDNANKDRQVESYNGSKTVGQRL